MLAEILKKYFVAFPPERARLKLLSQQVADGEALNDRKNWRGHIAGDGMVLSPDRTKLLMIHHKIFGFWLQPGGHWDPDDTDPLVVAVREVNEETGLKKYSLIEWLAGEPLVPIDIDTHPIPANPKKKEPKHFHHSLAYVFQATDMSLKPQLAEVHEAKWLPISGVEKMDKWHFPRIISKLRRLNLV